MSSFSQPPAPGSSPGAQKGRATYACPRRSPAPTAPMSRGCALSSVSLLFSLPSSSCKIYSERKETRHQTQNHLIEPHSSKNHVLEKAKPLLTSRPRAGCVPPPCSATRSGRRPEPVFLAPLFTSARARGQSAALAPPVTLCAERTPSRPLPSPRKTGARSAPRDVGRSLGQ